MLQTKMSYKILIIQSFLLMKFWLASFFLVFAWSGAGERVQISVLFLFVSHTSFVLHEAQLDNKWKVLDDGAIWLVDLVIGLWLP